MNQKRCLLTLFLFIAVSGISLWAQNDGENLYKSSCVACHTIGKGRLIGPDLKGVYDRADQDWLIRFIRSSQKMVKEGDSLAVALFKEYNQVPMPDNNLTDTQIISIIDYIRKTDSGGPDVLDVQPEQNAADSAVTVGPDRVLAEKGNALFFGYENFANGASSCIACHTVQNISILGGGKLSFDLTQSFSKLGPAGIKAILANPPFPAMAEALQGKNLTDDEILAITNMLQHVDQLNSGRTTSNSSGLIFFVLSLILAVFILVNIYFLYDNRKIPS